ncbi:MAG: hypothetical protein ACKPJT_22145 [Microcystis panniformis]|jgi:hypothetical protein|uniref:hypothetical protein n=1 Tax=Microcystis sp. LE19-84.1B TaxID=3016438 RepID=UPI0022CC1790|nr:hypothetical protein [Microcystis sp. LE19-84.1B]MCZ8226161.1 hypothetical protein [Microcystis sp. LE19-84.1B]
MQDTAHVIVCGKTIKVLRRSAKYGIKLRLRKSGQLGTFLSDESIYLGLDEELSKTRLNELLEGKVIYL